MAEATTAVNVTATYKGREHPVSVASGTPIERIWGEVKGVLGIPEDVEVYDGVTPVLRAGFGLPWNHRVTQPVTLEFQDYPYPEPPDD